MRKEIIRDCTIYLGKAEEVIPSLSPINAICTDPPFILSESPPGKSHFGMSLGKFEGKDYQNLTSGFDLDIFAQLEKICNPFNMFCFCSNKQISKIMSYMEERDRITTLLIWHKVNAAPFANGVWRGDIEYVVHARDKGAVFEGNAEEKKKVSQYPIVMDSAHPTVKPLELMKKYVKICSLPGQTVLDPFMGSGSTLVACALTGRSGIGIECEEKYFNLACERVENAYRQETLFAPKKMEQMKMGI